MLGAPSAAMYSNGALHVAPWRANPLYALRPYVDMPMYDPAPGVSLLWGNRLRHEILWDYGDEYWRNHRSLRYLAVVMARDSRPQSPARR